MARSLFQSDIAPLDVWFKFDEADDEEPAYEANTFKLDEETFVVEWSHVDVGLVHDQTFATYEAAQAWLESKGFLDFSS